MPILDTVANSESKEVQEMGTKNRRPEDYTVGSQAAAQQIGVRVKTLHNWVEANIVPAMRKGVGENLPYYFHPDDVKELERKKKQGVPANAITV